MADLRCPMCGKLNPAAREVCQFCQARLQPLQAQPPAEDKLPEPGNSQADSDLPDWLRALRLPGKEADSSPGAEEELPDWMAGEDPADQNAPAAGEELPDWLSSLRERTPGEETQSGQPEPEWMLANDFESELPAPKEEASEPGPVAEEEPEWLTSSLPEPPESFQPELGQPELPTAGETGEETPDWLASFDEQVGSDGKPSSAPGEPFEFGEWALEEETAAPAEPGEDIPDWMAGILDRESALPDATESFPEASFFAEQPGLPVSQEPASRDQGEIPPIGGDLAEEDLSWLKELDPLSPGFAPEPSVAPFSEHEEQDSDPAPLIEDALPDWLVDAVHLDGQEEQDPPKSPGELDSVPGEKAGGEPRPVEANLAPAEIPSWLEPMRPVESVAGKAPFEKTKEETASAGPLAGLSGILPAEPVIPHLQKPPSYLLKLQVSDAQHAHAALLEQMLKTEAEARPLPGRPAIVSPAILRLAIALVLFLSILWPVVTGTPRAGQPAFSTDVALTSQLIGSLNSGDPVLVAFDYEPGYSAEMDSAAEVVVNHLIRKGAYLTLVSTTPTGPAQAERVLAAIKQRSGTQYQSPGQYANLGFIPGGPAGLLSFAETPRPLLPFTLDGEAVWQSEPLQNVDSLGDFSLAMVITENPDTARAWIEQVQPALAETPLIMLVSAQAEPMIRPYYEADPNQVQGMVTGLAGAANYGNLTGYGDLTERYWIPFSLGLIAAILLILLGGAANAVSGLLFSKKINAGGENSQ